MLSTLQSLAAPGPRPDHAEQMMLFGQFIGDWEFEATWYRPDGSIDKNLGEWHFGWILEGRCVQDVWMVPRRAERERGGPLVGYGTTVRYYDPQLDAWKITWTGVVDGFIGNFVARREGDEIVLSGQHSTGIPMRWIFSDIKPTTFHWRCVVTRDDGKTWEKLLEMDLRRVGPAPAG